MGASVVVDDLDVVGVALVPDEAHAVLVVDANGVLALSVSRRCLQAVVGRDLEVFQRHGRVEKRQLPDCDSPQIARNAATLPRPPESLGIGVAKTYDHA